MRENTFKNPILEGFYPDPSICRVGEDYYLVNSSFSFFPGLPIFHSKDLVNWEQIGHALDRISQLNLDDASYTGGIFAPTIRYNNGTFYIITTNVSNGGNFIITAKDPAGPWTDPYWISNAPGIDPSLFFDDNGKAYYTGTRSKKKPEYFGDQEIWIQEIDLENMKLIGESYSLWNGALKNSYFPEAPHVYKVNDYYYLMIAESGTEHYHSVTIARSKNVFGPYEGNPSNPILTHRHLGRKYPISNPGHADLVETQNGEWYAVALASRPYGGYYKNLTRETFLIPVEWEDGWPVMSPCTGKIEFEYPKPNLKEFNIEKPKVIDNFDEERLDFRWNSLRTPREKFWSLSERAGYLRLKLRPQSIVDILKPPPYDESKRMEIKEPIMDCPSFLGRRQQHMNFEAITKMEFTPLSNNEVAGMILLQNDNHQFRVEYSIENEKKVIRLIKCTADVECNIPENIFKYKNNEIVLAKQEFESNEIYLKVTANGQSYNFYYGESLQDIKVLMEDVDGRILSSEVASGCSGTYIGLFATSNGQVSKNNADFDWFSYKEL